MKKLFFYVIAIACTFTATAQGTRRAQSRADGCNTNTAGWGRTLGKVDFKSKKTWKIGKQEWSDAVIAANCQKTTFLGGSSGSFNADCRQNAEGSDGGDLFSWCALTRFQRDICPRGWSVPTREDFMTLQKELEDIQKQMNNRRNARPVTKQMFFGPAFEGYASNPEGELISQGSFAHYWSSSEFGPNHGYHLSFNISDDMFSQANSNKAFGFTLRCVKTHRRAFPIQTPVMVELPKD
ncbi:MAG: fibrobacter succinogenes major paralogous domain-containing protein [Bacteroidales bacterium]|nr:fibrobacter succinogenes major paralogous domain-containing protein [Bacteroidales bacterium]